MITMTDEAAALIATLVHDGHFPTSGGLRLGTDPFRGSLAMHLSPRQAPGDVVVDHAGALLFLAPAVADKLRGQTLRAQLDDRPAFYLTT